MFVTNNQLSVFLVCVALGGALGVVFSVSSAIKFFVKFKGVTWVFDFFAFLIVGVLYALIANRLRFPNYRVYMTVGVFIGIFAYLKSFHILLAKSVKKIYNIIKSKVRKVRYDRRKNKKINSCVNGRSGAITSDTFNGDGLPTDLG